MSRLPLLAVSGALGTISRYLLGGMIHQWWGAQFPYGTLVVNIVGCAAIGAVGTLAEERALFSPELRAALLLGFLGAFTTFSSFTYETWELFKSGDALFAGLNVLGSIVGCFGGLLAGVLLARLL